MSEHIRDTKKPFDPTTIDGITAAIYTVLSDGDWHDKDEILAAAGRLVPAQAGYRRQVREGHPVPTGAAYVRAVASGQRKFADNRLMIGYRGQRIQRHPNNSSLYRAHPDVVAVWNAHTRQAGAA